MWASYGETHSDRCRGGGVSLYFSREHAPWRLTASWLIPVVILLALGSYVLESPMAVVADAIGYGVFVTMIVSERAFKWWASKVLGTKRVSGDGSPRGLGP